MDLSVAAAVQLGVALTAAVVVFVLAYAFPAKYVVPVLVVLVPFEPIESRYGTLNMVLILVVGAAMLLRGRLRSLPLALPATFVVLAYFASISMTARPTWLWHGTYTLAVISGLVLFYIVWNYIRETRDARGFLNLLVAMNCLVIPYCIFLLVWEGDKLTLLGSNDLALNTNRDDMRLQGPFNTPGIMAEYVLLQIIVLAYLVMRSRPGPYRWLLLVVILGDLVILVGTGNRTSFIVLLLSAPLFAWMFRHELGELRAFVLIATCAAMIGAASLVVVRFTDYDVLYERLESTEFDSGIPDTRKVIWPRAWSAIQERPVLGHGPRLFKEGSISEQLVDYELLGYPHNLYLYLLYTLGGAGLLAYAVFWGGIVRAAWRTRSVVTGDAFLDGLPRLGLLLLGVFFLDQMKVEFLRHTIIDFLHYSFLLMAAVLAFARLSALAATSAAEAGLRDAAARAPRREAAPCGPASGLAPPG